MPRRRRCRRKRPRHETQSKGDGCSSSDEGDEEEEAVSGACDKGSRFHITTISPKVLNAFTTWLLHTLPSQRPRPTRRALVTIDSDGGNLQSALAMSDLLQLSEVPVHMLVLGRCSSSAVLLLVSVPRARRSALPTAQFMLHFGTVANEYHSLVERRESNAKSDRLDMVYNYRVLRACRGAAARRAVAVMLRGQHDSYFTVKQAVKWGILPRPAATTTTTTTTTTAAAL